MALKKFATRSVGGIEPNPVTGDVEINHIPTLSGNQNVLPKFIDDGDELGLVNSNIIDDGVKVEINLPTIIDSGEVNKSGLKFDKLKNIFATNSILGTTGSAPRSIKTDSLGNIYTANLSSDNVTKITPTGTSTILGTTGVQPYHSVSYTHLTLPTKRIV